MSERRYRPPNRWGCKPTEDVCVEHDLPRECWHGCRMARQHQCHSGPDHIDVDVLKEWMTQD